MSHPTTSLTVKVVGYGLVSVMPEDVDISYYIQVQSIGSRYVKYLDAFTGEMIDCEVYAKQLKELLK